MIILDDPAFETGALLSDDVRSKWNTVLSKRLKSVKPENRVIIRSRIPIDDSPGIIKQDNTEWLILKMPIDIDSD